MNITVDYQDLQDHIESEVEEQTQTQLHDLVDKLDEYLDYTVNRWMDINSEELKELLTERLKEKLAECN